MALKKLKPTTPGQRGVVLIDRSKLHKGKPHKPLLARLKKSGGRNSSGRLTARNTGGGKRHHYRLIDFKRDKFDMPATVDRIEYDPNRTAFIALITYKDAEKAYILAPQKLEVGGKIEAGEKVDIKVGNAMFLRNIPVGTLVHNVELKKGKGGQMVRSAGAYAQIIGRDGDYVQLKLSSAEMRLVHGDCMATIGAVSNADNRNIKLGKAGRNRWRGVRPHTRGTVMNPVDHPLGGGEGKNFGRHPKSATGKLSRGVKTRRNKLTTKFIIRSRHKAKKK
ncbi:MAG: 50S ribosomal protein L2 [Alphaproteobacteria bacterium]|nr:MAG: 50S ribosomal protein L2 [Rickettsiaceae bacterium 4572_127]